MSDINVYFGNIVSSDDHKKLEIEIDCFIAVQDGIIIAVDEKKRFDRFTKLPFIQGCKINITQLTKDQFLMPGLIDCHVHGPQFPNIGVGLDRPLMEWLDKYTFPLEKRFEDTEFAKNVYDTVVRKLVNNGTTTACYFGSLHLDGSLELAKSVNKYGQRAFVGKVSMNKENPIGYFNTTEKELEDVEKFISGVKSLKNELVEPILTPRFALSCDDVLLEKIADLAKLHDLRIQSHISESKGEIDAVLETYPNSKHYTDVYNQFGILDHRTIMAHAVYLSEEEKMLFAKHGVSVAHCPASNTRLASGLCPVKTLMEHNIDVGLGTDIAGGDNASILDAMRRSMDVSMHLHLEGDHRTPLSWKDAFFLATLGGARALHLDTKIGNFSLGKRFDALLIDVYKTGGPIDRYDHSSDNDMDYVEGIVQRFLYLGDDRNIVEVYVNGKEIKKRYVR